MGIPGLTLRLINRGHWITMEQQLQGLELDQNPSDHSGQQSLGDTQEKEQQQHQQHQSCKIAIIDGPSLAYHICGEYREGRLANNEVALSPPYGEIGSRTIQFLEDLEAVTLKIHAIYFDGVLPPSKLDTRKQRLQKNMAQLKEAGSRARHFKAQKVPLPEPPFLVPAVLEALKDSKFSDLVTVVPAEADSYCAEEAAAYEARTGKVATIVTNDSDLLIQASGAQTRVMLLKGLTRSRAPDPIKVEANVFFPAQLAATARVDSLIPTAFFMNEEYHLSFDAAVAKAKMTDVSNNPYFTAFRKGLEKPQYSISNLASPVIKILQQMDPRIAELAHQLMPGFPKSLNEPANVFLPPLIEDVGKFSAWVAARDIREAAYRMLMSSTRNAHYIAEWTRRGTTAHYDSCPLIPGWRGKLLELKGILESVRMFPGLELATAAQRFNYTAMYYTVKAFADRNQVLSRGNILRVLTKGTQRSREELHALAMCQAAIYSLRILKQLLVLEKAMNGLDEEFATLEDLLGEAPSLAALFEKRAIDSEDFWRDLAGGLRDTVVQE